MINVEENIEQVLSNIRKIEDEVLSDFSTFWEDARKILAYEIRQIFATEGYGTWKPLSERYAKTKPSDKTILRLTDTYYKSATGKNDFGNVFIKTKEYMEYGVDLDWFQANMGSPYPLFHEKGTSRMPARQVFGLLNTSQNLLENLQTALTMWLQKEVRKRINV